MKIKSNEDIVYLDEGVDTLLNCPKCESNNFQFLPDIKSTPKPDGNFVSYEWRCFNCNTMFVQTKKRDNWTQERTQRCFDELGFEMPETEEQLKAFDEKFKDYPYKLTGKEIDPLKILKKVEAVVSKFRTMKKIISSSSISKPRKS